ncbi:uncharacterized protein M421DRAFT_418305 [Didymella exigua CBS 183.55]|uniref:26S proteasome complex subunit SEM1 n=1 Tax=Didymella exigua CBS 183.55 TaxID=1150837 RepID=A0A6A5RTG5_9PLEO|nr:uncharacterized protein M421DRAFT_418305 [Didymella exigua CBS 183.55]KAF1930829.1 hypothetical protein M421DRAFT_418305 [Didymella exigua CBS 183.55]
MSGAAQGGASTTKAVANEATNGQPAAASAKPAPQLEEDDEFEDFPVEDWGEEETQTHGDKTHLWEESWDDDDTTEDFANQLRDELKKLGK